MCLFDMCCFGVGQRCSPVASPHLYVYRGLAILGAILYKRGARGSEELLDINVYHERTSFCLNHEPGCKQCFSEIYISQSCECLSN